MIDKSAKEVAKALHSLVNRFGCPRILVSDNGREFVNELIREFTALLQVDHVTIAAYRPSANGLVESHNREVVNILKYLIGDNPTSWPSLLQTAEMAINAAYNSSIRGSTLLLDVWTRHPTAVFGGLGPSTDAPLHGGTVPGVV
ncbi:uncharacterized protein LOC135208585 [Macrobrachium nipponense]|uniref:uncharacterized protein LOC135208585 n=1 Tax=Macrobrachium nipponense TaxID=159736 RepID=UPI0030C87F54